MARIYGEKISFSSTCSARGWRYTVAAQQLLELGVHCLYIYAKATQFDDDSEQNQVATRFHSASDLLCTLGPFTKQARQDSDAVQDPTRTVAFPHAPEGGRISRRSQ